MEKVLKEELLKACRAYIADKRASYRQQLASLQEALASADKSSAGDKHNTDRAMVHLEQEKFQKLIIENDQLLKTVQGISYTGSPVICHGSVVVTDRLQCFISIPAGALTIGNEVFHAISGSAPIAKQLIGKRKGEYFTFNGQTHLIQEHLH